MAVGTSVLLAAALLVGGARAGAATTFGRYVALGDSYAAGPLIPNQSSDPIGCARSDHDYPADFARAHGGAAFVDVSCAGATTADMTGSQSVPLGSNPPQFDALASDTALVTITIGGNDIGFTSVLETCAAESLTDPLGNPCQRHYTAGGTDQLTAAIAAAAPEVAAVLAGIRQRAPLATVVVVGYLRILPTTGDCWPLVPIALGDVRYLGGVESQLNAMLGEQADTAGDVFVDAGAPTGHDACQPESQKWVEGFVPTSPAFPVHPNAAGMSAVAAILAGAV